MVRLISRVTRGRVRAGPSFQLITLSTRIADLLGACGASTLAPSTLATIYSADRRAPGHPDSQPM